jgi:outer membrane protein assembly factor BamB/Icc-related predicted phosphoesterase
MIFQKYHVHIGWYCTLFILCLFLPVHAAAQTGKFKFAQLTDIHLNPNNKQPTIDLLRSIDQINHTDSLDFVLVTGDLTEYGDRATLQAVKNCLSQLKVPYYVCLGNHETTWSESGCTAFSDLFGPETFKFEDKGVLFLGFNSGPLLRMAYGHVSPADINWLKKELAKAQKQHQKVILVTHYPMMEGDVDNWYDVTDAVRPYGCVRLFIGGHYHSMRNLKYDGISGILMRSNLRDENGKQGYGIYEVTKDSIRVYEQNVGEEKRFYASFDMQKPAYNPQAKADKYPDYSDNEKYPQVKEQWVNQTGGAFYSSPAVEKDKIFTGDNEGVLKAFALKNGKQLWSFHTGRRIIGTPATSEGVVVFGSADKNIYGLSTKKGKLLWTVKATEPVLGAVTIDKGIAYIGSSDSIFRAINIHTGKVTWTYRSVKGYVVTKPLVTAERVIFGAWDNTLYCLNKQDGKEMWKWTGGISGMHFSPAQVWPVEADGKVFITDPQRAMTAIDLQTGETVWRTYQSKVRETIGLSADKERLYSKTMQDSLVCYAAKGDKPRELWACNVGFGYEHGPSMPVEADGIVIETTKEGLIFAVEGKTGKLLWKHKIGNSLLSTPVALSSKKILFTSTDGRLGLLSVE